MLTITIKFTTELSPKDNPKHEAQVLANYFESKGINFNKETLTITI